MWLSLTTLTNKTALVDMSKVLHMYEVKRGTNIYYDVIAVDVRGQQRFKHITVRERIEVIAKLLRSKKP